MVSVCGFGGHTLEKGRCEVFNLELGDVIGVTCLHKVCRPNIYFFNL